MPSPANAADDPVPAGKRQASTRIVGGSSAEITEAPWQVALLFSSVPTDYDAQTCGGSIFTDTWIITAAHCVYDSGFLLDPSELEVVAGQTIMSRDPATSAPRTPLAAIYPHPGYDDFTKENDIALLELATPLALNGDTMSPVALPTLENPATWPGNGLNGLVTGWGNLSGSGTDYPDHLQKAVIPVIGGPSSTTCGAYGPGEFINGVMICGGYIDGGIDSCQGDSGGPYAFNSLAGWTLAGVVSWGNGCAQPNFPGVYTRVTAMQSWVLATTGNPALPNLSLNPPAVNFGNQVVGTTTERMVTATNTGNASMRMSDVSAKLFGDHYNDFNESTTTCNAQVLAPGASCTFTIKFKPASTGYMSETLRTRSTAPGSPHDWTLDGTGVNAMPSPVSGLTARATTKATRASWLAGAGATDYKVKVTGKNKKGRKKTRTVYTSATSVKVKVPLKRRTKFTVCVTSRNSSGSSNAVCTTGKVKRA